MFRPSPMQHVTVHVVREDAPMAALVLADCGVFNPETAHAYGDRLPELPGARYRDLYLGARALLDKIQGFRGQAPAATLAPARRLVTEEELAKLEAWLRERWIECSHCEEAFRRNDEERARAQELLRALDDFSTLDIDLNVLQQQGRRFLDVQLGTLPGQNLARLKEAAGLAGYLVSAFRESGGLAQAIAAGPVGREDEIRPLLAAAGWQPVAIPQEFRSRPEKVREELLARLGTTNEAEQILAEKQARTLAEIDPELARAEQALLLAEPYVELVGEALRARGGLSLISGWVPRDRIPELERALREQIGERFFLTSRAPEPAERSRVPSMIEYHSWLRPFAAMVRNYGVPRYGEIDPTLLFAASFVLMFGMMFGDIGHGGVIALAGVLLWRRLRGFGPFVLAIGASSAVFGWLYGSVFGIEHWLHPLWMSPMSDPVRMLTVALYWGIGFILVATVLTIINRLNDGDLAGAMLDGKGLAGLLFYAGGIYAVWEAFRGHFGPLELAALAVPMSAILGYKWHENQGPPAERTLVVLIEGFETVMGYFANTLSFLRVAAFSLNHVALFLAVFTIANMLGTAGHWITVILGNLFVLVLEGAIVAIQILRLEYYEGFSRFFSGDGREFQPLRPVSKINKSGTA
ncbi:MAG TPA: V-type ATPase 116kDa subunit family protein [Burkholderiales bacterium]|nr:V-type ATPase 116kDa subunit family protein [Burkholderiales bacterium]